MTVDLNHSSKVLLFIHSKLQEIFLSANTAARLLAFSSCGHTVTSVNRIVALVPLDVWEASGSLWQKPRLRPSSAKTLPHKPCIKLW